MSNQDTNGLELPWILFREDIYDDFLSKEIIKELAILPKMTRHKIIPNKLWKHNSLNSPAFALSSCLRDAIVHLNQTAANAILLHIQDAHKWKE